MRHKRTTVLVLCLAVVALLAVGAAPASAAVGSLRAFVAVQQVELTAADGAAGEAFGYAVAISGDTAVVGSAHTVGDNTGQGAAYIFVRSGGTWCQQAELTLPDGAAGDFFGCDVAIAGDTAVIGACNHAVGDNAGQGAAYVFVRCGTTWTQQAALTAEDGAADDYFGYTVAVSGDTIVVGASGRDVGDNVDQGAVYVFARRGETWSQQAELTAADGAAGERLGNSVAVSDDTAVAGSIGHTVGDNVMQGAAYVFVRSGATWTQQAELTAEDGAAGDVFGYTVAISGGTIVTGAFGRTVGDNEMQGAAYVFVRRGMTWTQQAELTAADGAAGDEFGLAVALSGPIAVVGAVGRNDGQGTAYVFVRRGTTWSQQAELTAADGAPGDSFSNIYGVAISGNSVVVGAPGHNEWAGAAYIYTGLHRRR